MAEPSLSPIRSLSISNVVVNAVSERTSQIVTPNSLLVEDLGLDSLSMLDLMSALETELEFNFEYNARTMRTVSDLAIAIQQIMENDRVTEEKLKEEEQRNRIRAEARERAIKENGGE